MAQTFIGSYIPSRSRQNSSSNKQLDKVKQQNLHFSKMVLIMNEALSHSSFASLAVWYGMLYKEASKGGSE